MAGIRIEGETEQEVQAVAVQMGVTVTQTYAKRGQRGYFGYGKVFINGTKRISVTQEQIDTIAVVFKYAADQKAIERAREIFEESQIVDVEFEVHKNEN